MNIAIIGTGSMGSGLAVALAAEHEVAVGGRDLGKAEALAKRAGHGAVGCSIAAAAERAGLIILAIPYTAVADVLRDLAHMPNKVLVDISNPISEDYKSLLVGHTSSAAEQIQALAASAKVVKAFNTIFARLLDSSTRKGRLLQVFLASDDPAAKEQVSELAKSMGFEPVDAGPLSNSRFLEPLGEMNIHFGYFLGWGPHAAPIWVRV